VTSVSPPIEGTERIAAVVADFADSIACAAVKGAGLKSDMIFANRIHSTLIRPTFFP
jgi:hypothetical protein